MRPSELVAASVQINGKAFDFSERKHLVRVYDTDVQSIVLKCARQVEKSTTASIQSATFLATHPYASVLYAAPTLQQARFFSRQRYQPIVADFQRPLAGLLIKERDQYSVDYRTYAKGRYIVFVHGQDNGSAARGYSSDLLLVDEIQDHETDALPVIEETQAHSAYKKRLYTGTPKSNQNAIEAYWRRSNQCEWLVKCQHCNTYQVMCEQSVTPNDIICLSCKRPLDRSNGAWVATSQSSDIAGFRVSQLMVPWVTPKELWTKLTTYSRANFYNEVLGLSFDSAMVPFPAESFVPPRVDYEREFMETLDGTEWANGETYAGVDWGTGDPSKTVITIGGITQDGAACLLYQKYFLTPHEMEVDTQVGMIADLLRKYRVRQCFVDYGAGLLQATQLRKIFRERVMMVQYVNMSATGRKGKPWSYDMQKGIVQIKKAYLISDLQMAHDHCSIIYPGASMAALHRLITDMSNEYLEYRLTSRAASEEIFYDHPIGTTDDGLHSLAYMWLAMRMVRDGELTSTLPSTLRDTAPMTFAVAGGDYDDSDY